MKLKELINEILASPEFIEKQKDVIIAEHIYGFDLLPYKDKILQCDEFSECTELIIVNHPLILDENNNPSHFNIIKFNGDEKVKGKCIILSLSLTPEMYDPQFIHEPVMDGAVITPTIYNPETFQPRKKIVLEFSPELSQDDIMMNGEIGVRANLHNVLDKVLDNPEQYQAKGVKHVLFRGLAEIIETPSQVTKNDLTKYNIPSTQDPEYKMVFFLESVTKENGEIGMELSKTYMPSHLSDKFIQEHGDKGINITRQEIEKFLSDNQ